MDTVIEIGGILKPWAGTDPRFTLDGHGQYSNRGVPQACTHRSRIRDDDDKLILFAQPAAWGILWVTLYRIGRRQRMSSSLRSRL